MEHKCPKCGESRHGSGFRFFVFGIGYCDACYPEARDGKSWYIGIGHYGGAVYTKALRV